MGVHGLWKLLESTGKPINPETLEGKVLAVDISIWLNQAVKGVRDRDGNSVQNAHLLTLFHRLCKLLFFRIKPIFVFDGDTPLLKRETVAKRRQRKEEMSRESKETTEKFLKTFLKRQAIRAALGEKSEEKFPSISSVRRDEGDDLYVLPALEERERDSSDEEVEKEWEQSTKNHIMWQDQMFENPNSMDIDSEEFALLPAEMKHEILKDMKESSKRRRTMFEKPPEISKEFSQYQLAGLLRRNQLNHRIESVEKELNQLSSAGVAEEYGEEAGQERSVEARRLVSEDSSHYILIKGSKKNEKPAERQPAVLPWASSSREVRGRPQPLWRPVSEDSPEDEPPSAAGPPSPRTLQAIQAAMVDSSSDEEGGAGGQEGAGELSPLTLLAIQRALTEDQPTVPGTLKHLHAAETPHPAPALRDCVTISSSEDEEGEASDEKKDAFGSNTLSVMTGLGEGPRFGEKVGLVDGAGLEERAGFGERGLLGASRLNSERDARLPPRDIQDSESSDSSHPDTSREEQVPVSWTHTETLNGGSVRQEAHPPAAVLCTPHQQEVTATAGSAQPRAVPPHPVQSPEESSLKEGVERRENEEMEGRSVEEVKSEESDSEESFIEVSGEEEEAGPDDMALKMEDRDQRSPGQEESEETEKESPKESQSSGLETEQEVPQQQEPPAPSASNEWAHIDTEELVQMESSLLSQQSSLQAQKQQQERVAATVTGQMCAESQELLRMFGVPFLVAPMEAEAQCAELDQTDHTHGTITDDSDIWLFGGRHVYKNFFSQKKYVEHYEYLDLQAQLGLDRAKLINLAYLLGSDYTEGLTGVGYVTGMEILNEFQGPGIEPLKSLCDWWKEAQEKKKMAANPRDTKVKKKLRQLQLHPGFPNPAVAQAYLQPAVDQSGAAFTWGRPHLEHIKDFCMNRFGWSSRKTEEVLQPVLKQLNAQQTQLRIDSFFRLEQQERQAIRSQRLRRAVTCMKRKEQGQEEEEEEEEGCSPAKKGNTEETAGKAGGAAMWAGGFLGSGDVPLIPRGEQEETPSRDQPKLSPPRPAQSSSSSTSGDDSDPGDRVTMVTARSVFQSKGRARQRKNKRK
ncbi:DNA excision repair protein ERCC-5 homolog [Conger conger]|uniref:DNA excision repair protein ERCC-5 homolog n=1 Tax=Conger conger TaxID=82655 RepID=UPI002A5ADEC5|nr:DNA excision repair protein ERCC-5 homolog [Conger conger]